MKPGLPVWRSLLYVPVNVDKYVDKAHTRGADVIAFRLAGLGPHSINLLSPLPAITDPVLIDGATQPGYAGLPLVELNGAGAGPAAGSPARPRPRGSSS